MVSIAEALAETGDKEEEVPAELKEPEEAKKKPEEEEEKKPAPKVEKPNKNEDNEREDKSASVKPVKEKEEEPEVVEEKTPKAAGKGKNETKKAVAITDTHDRKNPIKRIREWTKAYEGQTMDVDEHYPLQGKTSGLKFDDPVKNDTAAAVEIAPKIAE